MPKDLPRLGGGLIVRKGEAAPAVSAQLPPPPVADTKPDKSIGHQPKGIAGTIAITVRLDPERYEQLKLFGARQRRTNQQIMVAALDAYLNRET